MHPMSHFSLISIRSAENQMQARGIIGKNGDDSGPSPELPIELFQHSGGCGDLRDTLWPAFDQFYKKKFTLFAGVHPARSE